MSIVCVNINQCHGYASEGHRVRGVLRESSMLEIDNLN